ncbi:TSUP family transporter [Curtobacterium sp. 22159]|uniref:TSUP family transporter n=1 Tax=Curtobacterium sp. 22159 TaxID=3453882 RepID=UPI003F85B5FF
MTLVLLGVVVVLDRFRRSDGESDRVHSLLATTTTGITAGAINVVAGVGGVPLSVFAVLTRWRSAAFAASSQFVFTVMCVATIAGLATVGSLELPTFTAAQWVGAAAAIFVGVAAGPWLARHTSQRTARTIMLVTAGAGAVASIVKGITMA